MTCESKVHVVVSQEVSEACLPLELVSFDPRHVTRFPPIAKRI